MHIFFSCGETSGDKYAAEIVRQLIRRDPNIKCCANGGQFVKSAGANLIENIVLKSTIGFIEPLKNIPFYLKLMMKTKRYILNAKIDLVILIDHQGFNIPLAKWCKQNNIRVISLFAPQYWIWGKKASAHKFVGYCEKILCVFEREFAFYQSIDKYKTQHVGHPLIDLISTKEQSESNIIGVFPGSRIQEVKYLLPEMIGAMQIIKKHHAKYKFKLAIASDNIRQSIERIVEKADLDIEYVSDSRKLIEQSYASIVASGTITLEHALAGTPCVVCYKMNPFSYMLAMKTIWKQLEEKCFGFVSLPNILLEREVLPELLQYDVTKENIANELMALLEPNKNEAVSKAISSINNTLDESCSPMQKIVDLIVSLQLD